MVGCKGILRYYLLFFKIKDTELDYKHSLERHKFRDGRHYNNYSILQTFQLHQNIYSYTKNYAVPAYFSFFHSQKKSKIKHYNKV